MPPSVIVLGTDPGGPQIDATDVGVQIQIPAGPIQSVTGATSLNITIVGPTGVRHIVVGTASVDGTYAYFTSAATDFPVAGSYSLQTIAAFTGPTENLSSDVVTLIVGVRI